MALFTDLLRVGFVCACRTYRRQNPPPVRWRHCCIGRVVVLRRNENEIAAAAGAVDGMPA
jgi:hypothetical protein